MRCHISCQQWVIPVWQHCKKQVIGTPATSRHVRDMTTAVGSCIKLTQTNKQNMFSILIFVPYVVHVIHTINYKVMNDDAIDIRTFELIIISVFII